MAASGTSEMESSKDSKLKNLIDERRGLTMGNWNNILNEVHNTKSQYDSVRLKYIADLAGLTNRNVIAYYSAWLNKRRLGNLGDIDINDNDMNGMMTCIHNLDCSKGLDLILHTPGGDPTAAESIVNYLRAKFDSDIRVIVPQLAMSAGTMIACAGREIIMGRQSSLGPIDPQFSGIPAYNIKLEFEEAKKDLAENPQNAQYWAIKLQQYPAAFLQNAIDAIELSGLLLKQWLETCMFNSNLDEDAKTINKIVQSLNEHHDNKNHSRHFNSDFCKSIGLKIKMMEDEQKLQDAILSLHHAYMISLDETNAVKIIENQNGISRISFI